jgi:hypothetical protein
VLRLNYIVWPPHYNPHRFFFEDETGGFMQQRFRSQLTFECRQVLQSQPTYERMPEVGASDSNASRFEAQVEADEYFGERLLLDP